MNRLENDLPIATEEIETIDCSLAIKAIGYRSVEIPGLPFDEQRNVVPTSDGIRVGQDNGYVMKVIIMVVVMMMIDDDGRHVPSTPTAGVVIPGPV